MAFPVESPNYRHGSLPDPRTYIRLLRICSIDEARDVPVHCQLQAWSVDAAPDYTAISYTWGDPDLLEFIFVDDKKMEVRQNCGYVLRQAWQLKGSCYIWVDAICINQMDNDEKSHQVAMMGSVYQRAIDTLACVGRHENDSEFLYKTLHEKSHWWNQAASDPLIFRLRRSHLWGLLLRDSTKAKLLKSFNFFLGRQYFRRVWIYQELFFGRDIRVCCEYESVQISMFYQLHKALAYWCFQSPIMLRCSCKDLKHWNNRGFKTMHMLYAGACIRDKESFESLMTIVPRLQCEDPRDRFYGTRAVIDWKGMQPIEPDYNRDRFELALEVLQRLGVSRSFFNWLKMVQSTAESLHMKEEPPDKLNDAIRERQLSNSSDSMTSNPTKLDEGHRQDLMGFWGIRLLLNNGTWEFSRNTGTPAAGMPGLQRRKGIYTDQGVFPKIKKWSNGNPLDSVRADVVLSRGAKSKDWMLIPCSVENFTLKTDGYIPTFLAREGGEHVFHLVGKVLIFPHRLWPNLSAWNLFWAKEKSCAKYGVHIDPEDGLLLAHSLNWRKHWLGLPRTDDEDRMQLAEKYFGTNLCGRKSCTHVIPLGI